MLSNMHTNANSALNYSSQHAYSLNISPSSTAPFNQNPEQAPASNHPVANPAASGQNYVQKTNIQSPPITTSQPLVQPVANVAPQIAEQPEKSHANGTAEGELSMPLSIAQSNKPSAPVPTSPQKQNVEADKPSAPAQYSASETVSSPTKTADNVQKAATSPTLEPPKELTPKEPDSPTTRGSTPESDRSSDKSSSPSPKKEEEPPQLDEKEKSASPEKNATPEPKVVEPKEDFSKKETTPVADKVKASPAKEVTSPGKSQAQQEAQEAKTTVKAAPRKPKSVVDKAVPGSSSGSDSAKRQRMRTQHYQSPLPEVELVSKISTTSLKNNDDKEKLIVFYKNEFLAVRNAEGSFYLCQAVQNIYKSSPKIRIRWLSQESQTPKGEVYTPDFYDNIDFDCILTNLSLRKSEKGKFVLPTSEKSRTESILNRSLAVEKGEEISSPSLTEEHPDGLDLSFYRGDEDKKKRKTKKRSRKATPSASPKETPTKKSPKASKVRKVESPAKKATPKKVAAKKTPSRKPVAAEPKPVATTKTNPKASSGKANSKPSSAKTSPVVDSKKAKVLARIGRKAAVAAPAKNAKNVTKNEKVKAVASTSKAVASTSKAVASTSKAVASTSKAVASTSKAALAKTSSNGSVKNARTVRKSSRK